MRLMFMYVLLRSIASRVISTHTPSIGFRDLPPNCQNLLRRWRGTLYLRAAVLRCFQSLRKVWVLIRLEATQSLSTHDSNNFGFISAGVSNVGGYKRNADTVWVVWYKRSAIWAPTKHCQLFWDLWRNHLWQWLEDDCRKPVLGVWLVPILSGGADRGGGQMRGNKECPSGGITNNGTVWTKGAGKRGLNN